jgi:hypothetical protein
MTLHAHSLLLSPIGDTRAPAARDSTRYVAAGAKEFVWMAYPSRPLMDGEQKNLQARCLVLLSHSGIVLDEL